MENHSGLGGAPGAVVRMIRTDVRALREAQRLSRVMRLSNASHESTNRCEVSKSDSRGN